MRGMVPTLPDLDAALNTDGLPGAQQWLRRHQARPMPLDTQALLDALRDALRAHASLLDASPEWLPVVVYPHLRAAGLRPPQLAAFYDTVPLPPLRLRFPVALADRRILTPHIRSAVLALASAPGGQFVAVSTRTSGTRIWHADAPDAAPMLTLAAQPSLARALAWSPDGQHIFAAHRDGTVLGWTVPEGETALSLSLPGASSCAASAEWLVIGSDHGTLHALDRTSGAQHALSGLSGPIVGCAVAAHQAWAVTRTGQVVTWNLQTGAAQEVCTLGGPMHFCAGLPQTPDQLVVVGAAGVALLSTEPPVLRWSASPVDAPLLSGALSPDGARLVTGRADNGIDLWSLKDQSHLGVFWGHQRPAAALTWGERIWSGGSDQSVRAWSSIDLRTPGGALTHASSVRACAFSPDRTLLASGARDGAVRLWCPETGQLRHHLSGHTGAVYDVAFSPSGAWLASVATDKTLRLWRTDGSRPPVILREHAEPLTCCTFVSESCVISGGRDHCVRGWDVEHGALRFVLSGHTHWVRCCALGAAGLLTGSYDGTLRLWDVDAQVTRVVFEHHTGPVIDCALSPDGTRAVSVSLDQTLCIWDLSSGALLQCVAAHTAPCAGVAMLGASSILSVGQDGWLKQWCAQTGVLEQSAPLGRALDAVAAHQGQVAVGDRTGNLWLLDRSGAPPLPSA